MKQRFFTLTFLFAFAFNYALSAQWFVDQGATGTNDGTSWTNAFTDLQDALALAVEGDQIWIAEGTYRPASSGGSSTATFRIDKNLQLYGGFAGTEATLAERGDPTEHPTLFSGDLNGDDVVDDWITNRGDNVMTVVTVTANVTDEALLDGLTIQNGHADGSGGPFVNGGGVYSQGNPGIRRCTFRQNFARLHGGGVYFNEVTNGAVLFEYCTFDWNLGVQGGGANLRSCAVVFEHCHFSNNRAMATLGQPFIETGGGLYTENTHCELRNCTFANNLGQDAAGGLFFGVNQTDEVFNLAVDSCVFTNNVTEGDGGALCLQSKSGTEAAVQVTHCLFEGNQATSSAGALWINTGSNDFNAWISHCSFSNNRSPLGAAVGSTPDPFTPGTPLFAIVEIENCLLTGNNGEQATISLDDVFNLFLNNCTVAKNHTGGVATTGGGTLVLLNTVLYNPPNAEFQTNHPEAVFVSNGGNLIFDNSLNDYLTGLDHSGIEPGLTIDDLKPAANSPLVNQGINNGHIATLDLAGNTRIQHGFVDIGAYESPFTPVSSREVIVGVVGLSPNPATEVLSIALPQTVAHPFQISIFDQQGRLVSTPSLSGTNILDVQQLPAGIYSVRIIHDEKAYVGQFVKL